MHENNHGKVFHGMTDSMLNYLIKMCIDAFTKSIGN